jgi:hypothetical protein
MTEKEPKNQNLFVNDLIVNPTMPYEYTRFNRSLHL